MTRKCGDVEVVSASSSATVPAMPERLAKKVALVTAAGSGIGRAIALQFASEGADVVVNDLAPKAGEPDGAAETAELCREASKAWGGKALVIHADVSDRPAVERMVEETAAQMGRLDVSSAAARARPRPCPRRPAAAARASVVRVSRAGSDPGVRACSLLRADLRVERVVLAARQLPGHGLGVGAAHLRGDAVWRDARVPVRGETDGGAGRHARGQTGDIQDRPYLVCDGGPPAPYPQLLLLQYGQGEPRRALQVDGERHGAALDHGQRRASWMD